MTAQARYEYKGKNLTTVILQKIERVVELLSEKELRSFEDCYQDFAASRTFLNLQNTNTLLWGENAEYIVDDYYREKDKK
jgi:hypothetical protein